MFRLLSEWRCKVQNCYSITFIYRSIYQTSIDKEPPRARLGQNNSKFKIINSKLQDARGLGLAALSVGA